MCCISASINKYASESSSSQEKEASHILRTTNHNTPFSLLKKMRLMLATFAVGWLLAHVRLAMGDVGTAQSYSPPYLRT